MTKQPLIVLSALFTCLLIGSPLAIGAKPKSKQTKRVTFQLPKNAKEAVIVLDYKGGFTPPRTSDKPAMTIRADGTVLLPARFAGQKSFRGKLTSAELQDLLNFIIVKNEFLKYDEKTVKNKLAKNRGLQLRVADAATVVIRVHIGGKTKEARRYALGMGHDRKVKELRQLSTIHRRLQQVSSVVRLGGTKAVAKWLKLANAQLKAKYPKAKPLAISDMQSGGVRSNGSVYVSFNRRKTGANGQLLPNVPYTSVTINQPAKGKPRIFVRHAIPGAPRVIRPRGKAQAL